MDEEMHETWRIWEFFGFATEGFFVEVGANDPKTLSVTWLLERVGWRGILVEPLPDKSEALRKERPNSKVFTVAVSSEDKTGARDFYVKGALSSLQQNIKDERTVYDFAIRVNVVTLDSLLEEANVPRLDLVSIDTEGTEYEVLEGFDISKYQPSLILVEDVVHTLRVHNYLRHKRYRLIRRTGFNNWYVPSDSRFKTPVLEKLKLFRKMYLGTPLRAYRFKRRQRKGAKSGDNGREMEP
jgi:FkbM family methyltransferase